MKMDDMNKEGPIDMSKNEKNENKSDGSPINVIQENYKYDNEIGSPEPEDLTIHEEQEEATPMDIYEGLVSSSRPIPDESLRIISSPVPQNPQSPPSSPPPPTNNESIQSPPSSSQTNEESEDLQDEVGMTKKLDSSDRPDAEENVIMKNANDDNEGPIDLSNEKNDSSPINVIEENFKYDNEIGSPEPEDLKIHEEQEEATPMDIYEGLVSSERPIPDEIIRSSPVPNQNESIQSPPCSPPPPTNNESIQSPPSSPLENSESIQNSQDAPQSPEASINSSTGLMGTPISMEEFQSQSSPPPPPKKEKAAPKKPTNDEIEEGEDLEDGEIMDEEEEEEEVPEVVEKKPEIKPKSSKKESSSEKHKSREKEKSSDRKRKGDKEKDKDDLDPVKRLLAEVKEKDVREKEEREKRRREKKRSHKDEKDRSKDKDSKKKRKISEEEEDGPEFLFVRGASPGPGIGGDENWEEPDDRRNKKRRESDDANSPAHNRHRRGHEGSTSPVRNRPANDRPKRVERREPKSDVICAYFMQGKCQKSSEQCNFSHDCVPPRKMELCKFWMMECCAKKEKCLYLHNDFPCKFYHTGLVCRMAENCKFSHNPLSDVTKQVLLKHIETAPKEILGDFPRLNRTGALNLINKMEAKLKGLPFEEEENNENENGGHQGGHPNHGAQDRHGGQDRHGFQDRHQQQDRSRDNRGHFGGPGHHDNSRGRGHGHGDRGGGHDRGGGGGGGDRRQSRWEQSQPTRVDQEKLQELMSEAGISGYYKDTLEENRQGPHPQSQMFQQSMQNNMNPNMMPLGIPLPPFLPQMLPQGQVNNPALASVLAQLNIPSSTIIPPNIPNYPPPSASSSQSMSQMDDQLNNQDKDASDMPDNLPKMQRELFRRIQQQQIKNENKVQTQEKSEPEEPEENWYSDDEEEDNKKKSEDLKAEINDQISSVLNQIRQQSQQQSSTTKEPESLKNFFGDTDLRASSNSATNDFKDVDLRTSSSSIFKKINILPATEINASLSSHGPVTYKVYVVAGLRDKPDYAHMRQTLTPQAILMDPRFGSKKATRSNSIPAPDSPTDQSSADSLNQPMSIPNATPIFDPRTMKGGGSQQNIGRGLLDNPFVQEANNSMPMPGLNMNMNMNNMNMNDYNNPFNRDPRQANNVPPPTQQQQAPNPAAAAQLASFAALMQQWPNGQPPMDANMAFMLGLPFFPQGQGATGQQQQQNTGGMDFSMLQNTGMGRGMRPPFIQGNQGQPSQPQPASSWERFNRGQGNLSPPL